MYYKISRTGITQGFRTHGRKIRWARRLSALLITAWLLSFLVLNLAQAAPGDLDTTFGAGTGKVNVDFNANEDTGNSVGLQSDGKIVIGGVTVRNSSFDFALIRLNHDGSLDTSFGNGTGKVATDFFNGPDFASALAIQSDGKIVLAGGVGPATGGSDFGLVRYNSDGSLDSSFGNGGKVTTPPGGQDQGSIVGLAIQPDGKIVAAGTATPVSGNDFTVARYNSNGSLDSSFGNNGIASVNINGNNDIATSLILQPDGKIVVAGYSEDSNLQGHSQLARFDSNGALDTTFSGGTVLTTFAGDNRLSAVALQPNGQIVGAGVIFSGSTSGDFLLTRFNSDGSVDSGFGSAGLTVTDFFGSYDQAHAVSVQPDGKIVLIGRAANASSNYVFAVARYDGGGQLDTTFGNGGKVTVDFFNNDNRAMAGTLQRGLKIVAAGFTNTGGNSVADNFAAVRLFNDEVAATPSGSDVIVHTSEVTINYGTVSSPGTTKVVSIDPNNTGAALPQGYTINSSETGYDISTTASAAGPFNVCVSVPFVNDPQTFAFLRLLHQEGSNLVDRTRGQDFASRLVCGQVSSLSPFVIAQSAAPTAAPVKVAGQITTADGRPMSGVLVQLSGASSLRTLTDGDGFYSFDGVDADAFYTVKPALANYSFSPAERSFSLLADKTDAVFTATPDTVQTTNPLETTEYFVRQQYLDFLGREPDQGGLAYWSGEIARCGGDAECIQRRRIDVAAAFFIEDEFQQRGSFIYRLYKGALGRQVSYREFFADRQRIVDGDEPEASKVAFTNAFVGRPEFTQKYSDALTGEAFVEALIRTVRQASGADLSGRRTALLASYDKGRSMDEGRALALREAIEDASFKQAEYNRAFVLTQYFGYLKREPEQAGFDFWLNVLDNKEPGNYRGMVCSFITSEEYQRRFSSIVTRSNQECR